MTEANWYLLVILSTIRHAVGHEVCDFFISSLLSLLLADINGLYPRLVESPGGG